jgi:hypothetical protein
MSTRTDIYGRENPEMSDSELHLLREDQMQRELRLQLVPVTPTPMTYEDPARSAAVLAALRVGEAYDIVPEHPVPGNKKPSKSKVRPFVICPGVDWDVAAQDWLLHMPVVGEC